MGSLLASAFLFTTVVVVLTAIVLSARRWLSPGGTATLTVNGQGTLVAAGRNVLSALQDEGIYLPAACGGRGLCGQCKVTFIDATRPALPTEMNHLTRGEAKRGVRLACANRIRGDLALEVSEELVGVGKRQCAVQSARNVTPFLREVTLALPGDGRLGFAAGQYVLIEAPPHRVRFADFEIEPEYRDDWDRARLFTLESRTRESVTRAYSLANSPAEDNNAVLVIRIAIPPPDASRGTPPGIVSSYMFGLRPGDTVDLAGPFGTFRAEQSNREMILIAGGAGIAPMRSIILDQLTVQKTDRPISFWYGVRSRQDLCYENEFHALAGKHENFSWHVALSEPKRTDEWTGSTGFIHSVVFERYLKTHPAPEEAEYYLCGPPVMSTAVTHMLEDIGVDASSIHFDDFGTGR